MGDKQMPNHCLKCLTVWRKVPSTGERDENDGVRHFGCMAAIVADDPDNPGSASPSRIDRPDQVLGNCPVQAAAADRQDEQSVLGAELADLEPFRNRRCPAIVIRSCRELRNVIGRRIRFNAADFPKVVYCMAGVGRASAHPENEKPVAGVPDLNEGPDTFFAGFRIKM